MSRWSMVGIVVASTLLASFARGQIPGGNHIGIGRSPVRDDPAMREIAPELELRLANGVNLIIAHARDLQLSSEQLTRIAAIKRRLDSLNTPLMRELDVLEHDQRQRADVPHARGDKPDEPDPAVQRTVDTLRANMHAAESDAYEALSGTQLQQALQLVKQARTNAALSVGTRGP